MGWERGTAIVAALRSVHDLQAVAFPQRMVGAEQEDMLPRLYASLHAARLVSAARDGIPAGRDDG